MLNFHSPYSTELLSYWQSLRKGTAIPTTEDFLDHVPTRIAPYMILFECIDNDLIVRLIGTLLDERWGGNMTGKSWLRQNPHLKAANVLWNFTTIHDHPCAARALGGFVTNNGRTLSVETISFPVAVRQGRPPRVVSGSYTLQSLDLDEYSRGRMAPRTVEWVDLGSGTPQAAPKLL
jgi:hypothetical protein